MIYQIREQYSSHIPALHTLAALGYAYFPPDECIAKLDFSFPCSCVGTHVESRILMFPQCEGLCGGGWVIGGVPTMVSQVCIPTQERGNEGNNYVSTV